ncbi:hypothetical protein NJF45_14260 [Stenotrophomonas maltophilia]|uniref:hypothetical protein n=1 Tax=Stenotrophomonas maltophilia TaxID=40324 RepID=UPI0020972BCC|nr:hypothetical protein [Stenotrophomonas maltophilia]MCO7463058.1 hypothetical protein [Stenotrophomonas maltophilia]
MPIEFRPDSNSAFDALSAVRISYPRVQPATLSDGREVTEYQYTFRRDGERVASLGIFGTETLAIDENGRERIYTLDLSTSEVLKSIIDFKEEIGNSDEASAFIRAVAQGLVNVFSNQPSIFESIRYIAVARIDSLLQLGIAMPADRIQLQNEEVVLGSLFVPQKQAEAG